MNLNNIRQEYLQKPLNISDDTNPMKLFKEWFQDAINDEIDLVNAITLSTIGEDGFPNARIVLAKEISETGLIVYTDYTSQKSKDLLNSSKASITIFWKEQDRQIRIKATSSRISYEQSDKYFRSRPLESQISAIASSQSSPVNLEELQKKITGIIKSNSKNSLPCPKTWGGYAFDFFEIEFWQGRPNRLHDRFNFKKNTNGTWNKSTRLSP